MTMHPIGLPSINSKTSTWSDLSMACHGDTDVVLGIRDVIRPTVLNMADEGRVDVIVTASE